MNAGGERLFVALPVPDRIKVDLGSLQPAPGPGVRLSEPRDMHVTLHFLGKQDVEPIAAAFRQVRGAAFTARPGACGSFSLRGGQSVLWVGIVPSPPMLVLHAAIGVALRSMGFEPESRLWVPHITLARLGANAPQEAVRRFARPDRAVGIQDFECRSFALFASETKPEGARYRVIEEYLLG